MKLGPGKFTMQVCHVTVPEQWALGLGITKTKTLGLKAEE